MRQHMRRAIGLTMILGLALGTGACSSTTTTTTTPASAAPSTPAIAAPASAVELVGKVKTAVAAAKSATAKATGTTSGKSFSMDMSGTLDAKNSTLKMTQGGGTVETKVVDGAVYLKADKAFWEAQGQAAAAAVIGDKWAKLPPAQSEAFTKTSISSVLTEMLGTMTEDKLAATVESADLDGKKVFVVTHAKGKDEAQMFVAADGTWLPVKVTGKTSENAVLTLSEWNSVATVVAPAADQVLDMSKL